METGESSKTSLLDSIETSFKRDIIKEVIKIKLQNPKNKITEEALDVMSEVIKALAIEAAVRAIKQAKSEFRNKVTLEHVETILPQLMLDMP